MLKQEQQKQQARIQRFEQLEKEVKQTDSKESLAIRFDQTRIGKRVFQLKMSAYKLEISQLFAH